MGAKGRFPARRAQPSLGKEKTMIQQLSIYLENRKGALQGITRLLTDARINMNTLIASDSAEYGIIRMLVSDPEKAEAALQKSGLMCRREWVLAVAISDECGSLDRLLQTLLDGNINIDYVYVTYSCLSKLPVAIMKTNDMWEVEEFLTAKGFAQVERIAEDTAPV